MNDWSRVSRRRGVAGLAGVVLAVAGRSVAGPAAVGLSGLAGKALAGAGTGLAGAAVAAAAAGEPVQAGPPGPSPAPSPAAGPTPATAAEAVIAGGPALPALEPATLRYALYYGALSRDSAVAEATYRVEPSGSRYRIATEGRAIGLVSLFYSGTLTQSSEGRCGPAGLQPERYVEQRGRRPERQLRFDAARRVMIGTGSPPEVAAPPGTQDRLSVFFQLGLIARGRPALIQPGRRFTLPLASMRSIDLPTFTVVGRAGLRTALGVLDCVHVTVRNEADAHDPVFDVWLSIANALLPARIRMQEHDGKMIDQLLQQIG